MADLPTIITLTGLQPQAPVSLWQQLLANVAATNPDYTANLPGSLIEDISSTDVASLVLIDTARVETVDSLTPYGCNAWLLNNLGQVYGIQLGTPTLTSVGVIFSGTPGYVVPIGFIVSDGAYEYVVQDGGIIGNNGNSLSLFCLAVVTGTWAIPPGTVTQTITSAPAIVGLTCSNPLAGVPGQPAEDETSYRSRVLQAGLAAAQGMPSFMKTLICNVPGVVPRLVSVVQQADGGWEVIVGGGDTYQVAYAIFQGILDVSTLIGSTMVIDGITNANPGVITTVLNHGYSNGQIVTAEAVQGMTSINNVPLTVTVIDETNFSTGVNTGAFGTYIGGGLLLPNLRNNFVAISNYPNVYQVPFVTPPLQTVTVTLTWNTTATNFFNFQAVQQLGAPAIAAYVNSVPVGQPINLFQMQTAFQEAISSVLSPTLLTRMIFVITINNIPVVPVAGSEVIYGDPESYFQTDPTGLNVVISQG